MAYSYNKSKSGFLFVFLSLCLSIHSAISFPTVSSSNSNPISRMCVDDSSGKPLFCRRVHIRWKQQHHRRLLLTNRLWSSARTDESNDSNDNDGDISTNRKAVASPLTVAAYAFTLYRQYTDLCRRRPFLTSSITAGVLAAAGDVLSQSIAAGHGLFLISTTSTATTSSYAAFNWVRWRTFLLTGLLFEGPWVCFWYQGLWKMGRWMERNFQAKSRLQVVAQTVLDQTVGVSIFFPLYFLVYEVIGATVSGQGMYCTTTCRLVV